jgi:hypothetical protein
MGGVRLVARVWRIECAAEQECWSHSHLASETRCESAAEHECGGVRARQSQSAAEGDSLRERGRARV